MRMRLGGVDPSLCTKCVLETKLFRVSSDGIFLMRGPFRAFTDTRTREYVRGGFGALLAV